jgi:hypothetical protein
MDLKLPLTVVSQVDAARVLRELNALDDFFVSAAVRKTGVPMQPPRLTRSLGNIARDNGLNLLEDQDRKALAIKLDEIIGKAPILHISFAAEPSPAALERILIWLRDNIHPQVLVQVGLQPNIAAGCVLRSNNRIFDMSLRSFLDKQEPYLVQLIAGAASGH